MNNNSIILTNYHGGVTVMPDTFERMNTLTDFEQRSYATHGIRSMSRDNFRPTILCEAKRTVIKHTTREKFEKKFIEHQIRKNRSEEKSKQIRRSLSIEIENKLEAEIQGINKVKVN